MSTLSYHILFHPHPGGGLTNANAEFVSLYGLVQSAWEIKGADFIYKVTIPANTTASVTLPKATIEKVMLNGKALPAVIKKKAQANGTDVVIELGSGSYSFSYPSGNEFIEQKK